MTLEEFQKNISETAYKSNKEKFKNYYYNIFEVTEQVISLKETLVFAYVNQPAVIKKIENVLTSSLLLLNELSFPINTSEFSLDQFKNNIKANQPTTGVADYNYYVYSMIFSTGRLNGIIKQSIMTSKQELDSNTKMSLLNIIYDVIVNLLLLTDYLGLNIDIIIEKYLENK